jgi:acyl-CoA synthetase (AMP-forming)/AMP-acid ligase II
MWNFADIVEAIAKVQPDEVFHVHGSRRLSWGQLDERSETLAQAMARLRVPRQSVVAVIMRNRPEFVLAYVAAWKSGHIPANVSYRYSAREMKEVLDDCSPCAVVFDNESASALEPWAVEHPDTRFWAVDASSVPEWAVGLPSGHGRQPRHRDNLRSGDDIVLLYTGGTTGRPKGVMWRQDDMAASALGPADGTRSVSNLDELMIRLTPNRCIVVPCPLMHATGLYGAYTALVSGGTLVTLDSTNFDARAVWTAVSENGGAELYIVGDAFALPLTDALEAMEDRQALRNLEWINSAGAIWSGRLKARMLRALPHVKLYDYYGSSEANSLGSQVSVLTDQAAAENAVTTTFQLGEEAALVSQDGTRLISPGSDEVGIVAAGGRLPLGYLGDPDRSAQLFRQIDGRRFLLSGDHARFSVAGALIFLGRGSSVINTGGEKVFAEEVDAVLKRHPAVVDAVCAGVPDERFGEMVGAVVSVAPASPVDGTELIEFARLSLAAYKLPRRLRFVDRVPRTEAGKPDYQRVRALLAIGRGDD